MPTLQQYWESAQLSQSAYIDLAVTADNDVRSALSADSAPENYRFSDTQAGRLIGASGFSVSDNRANTNDAVGFSATLFKANRPGGKYVLALRGTELGTIDNTFSLDRIVRYGLAAEQIAAAYNYFQRLITPVGEGVAQIVVVLTPVRPAAGSYIDVSTSENEQRFFTIARYTSSNAIGTLANLPAGTRIDVTGHSLGGHLAQALSRLFPERIETAYAHNTAGFYPFNADAFFQMINPSIGGFDNSKIKNVYSYNGGEYIANTLLHTQYGERVGFAIEDQAPTLTGNHSMTLQARSLALHALFAQLAPSFDTGIQGGPPNYQKIDAFVRASAPTHASTYEATLRTLVKLFLNKDVSASDLEDVETFYSELYGVKDAIGPNSAMTLVSLVDMPLVDLTNGAGAADGNAIAYRYALKELNPFAVLGPASLYQSHNQNGELDRFVSTASTPAGMTTEYLADRAAFLTRKNAAHTADVTTTIDAAFVAGERLRYVDLPSGVTVTVSNAVLPPNDDTTKRFVFGGDGADAVSGGSLVDRLYGGTGSDLIAGGKSDDYLEGGAGMDVYTYNAAASGSANDGNDTLRDTDGKGVLRYTYAPGSGPAQIKVMAGAAIKESDTVWHSADARFTYTRAGADLTVTINGDSGGTLTLKGFQDGDFGIRLMGTVQDPAPQNFDIQGDREPIDFDPNTAGVQTQTDALGNIITDPNTPAPDRADTLYDSTASDWIEAGGGDDVVIATRGGGDWIFGGAGRDSIQGGAGEDLIEGGSGEDILRGGAGNDRLYGRDKVELAAAIVAGDTAPGFAGRGDALAVETGDDVLVGSGFADLLTGGAGKDVLVGGAGDDVIFGDSNAYATTLEWTTTRITTGLYPKPGLLDFVLLDGVANLADDPQAGADTIYAGAGNDWVNAGAGDDFVDAGPGDDFVFGDTGNDVLLGGEGDDVLDGDYATSTAAESGDDYLEGGAGSDWLFGRFGDDILLGGEGADYLDGGAGNDILVGGAGNDILRGGAGKDTYVFNRGDGREDVFDTSDTANVAEASVVVFGSEIVRGQIKFKVGSLVIDAGEGDELHFDGFNPNDAANTQVIDYIEFADGSRMTYAEILDQGFELAGTEGDDDIDGTNLNENIDAKGGEDIVRGHGGRDAILGGAGNDRLHGGEGDDTLDGGADADALFGDAGADTLVGGEGDDTLDGGLGDDALAGGAGIDSYLLYGGMGNDTASDGHGGEANVLSLVPGVSLANLRFTQVEDALEIGLAGTADTLTIEDYYTRTQAWAIRDAEGNETDLEDALLIPDPNVGNYVAQLREEARLGQLARAGGAAHLTGWKSLGGGLFEGQLDQAWLVFSSQTQTETFTRFDPPNDVLASFATEETGEEVLSFGELGGGFRWTQHRLEQGLVQSDDAEIFGGGNALPQVQTAGEAVLTLRKQLPLLNYQESHSTVSTGVVSYDTGSAVILANRHVEIDLVNYNRSATVTLVDEDAAATWGQPANVLAESRVLVDLTRIENRYRNVVEIVAGASDNAITATSGGAGIFSVHSLVDGGEGNDIITGSGFLYGNAGDDTITASRSTIIGGDGDDTLTGTGESRFVFTAGEIGVDAVSETGNYALSYLEWLHGASVLERYQHGGEYRLDLEGPGSYYASFAEADAVRQGFGFGEIVFIEPLGATPMVRRGDTQAMEQLIAAGVMPRDTVEFGPGVMLEDLALELRVDGATALANPDAPWAGGGTLSVRWGEAGFDIDVPDADYGLVGDMLLDQLGDGENFPTLSYRLGEGVETFRFADGTSYSLEQVLAQATLRFGAYTFLNQPGEQLIDRRFEAVAFESGLGSFGLQVSRDGVDLVFNLPFEGAQGRIAGWYADPDDLPEISLNFEGDSTIDAETLTQLGLEVAGTEGDDVIAGLPGFDDIVFGNEGNDAITGASGADELIGGDGNDTLDGDGGEDYLEGGQGLDLLRGGADDDELGDFEGANLLDGGDGADTLAFEGANFVVGGMGGDYIEAFGVDSVLAFNAGDGADTIYAGEAFTLSLGGGIAAEDLVLSQDGDDLALAIGATDSIRLTREFESDPQAWPAITLQLFGSVHTFDFNGVIADFQAARAADPQLEAFPLGTILEDHRTGFSQTEALGGALAWQYATTGSLEALSEAQVREVLGEAGFGAEAQPTGAEPPVNHAPVVSAADSVVFQNRTVQAASLFSVADADDDAIVQYEFWDNVAGGGYFSLNGVEQGAGQAFAVSAAELANAHYVGGSGPGVEQVGVRAFDGSAWGEWQYWNLTSAPRVPNAAPEVTSANATVLLNGTVSAASIFSATDADDEPVLRYQFYDKTPGGGHFAIDGVEVGVNVVSSVPAAELADIVFVASDSIASDLIWVRAYDGQSWGDWKSGTIGSWLHIPNAVPVVTAGNSNVLLDDAVAVSSLFAATDADNDPILQVQFYDNVSGGGHFTIDGVETGAQVVIPVSAADLANTRYVAGSGVGMEKVGVRVSDGMGWSAWQYWNITSALHIPNAAPQVMAVNSAVLLDDAVAAASLFTAADADNDVITHYEFWDKAPGNGHFTVNGVQAGENVAIPVSAADLANIEFVAAGAIGSDQVLLRVSDGMAWSSYKSWTVNSVSHLTNAAPVVSAANNGLLRGETVSAASLFGVTDADGDAITQYKFWDEVNGGGQWRVDGAPQAAGQAIVVAAADLADTVYAGGANPGTEQVWVSAFDGMAWSNWKNWLMSTEGGLVRGGAGPDTLTGDPDTPILQGGGGGDTLTAGDPNSLLDGGEGGDTLNGGAGNDLLIGGAGDDTLHTGGGSNLIAYNAGDGADTIYSSAGSSNTLSLGGGLRYQDLSLSKSGDDLVLDTGGGNQLTFKDWYAGYDDVLTLQMIIDASADFDANSADPLANQRVQSFDFAGLVSEFDTARAGDPGLNSWAVTNALLQYHLAGADDAALGGDLAYQYGSNDTLAGIGLTSALDVLASGNFGALAQQLRPLSGLQEGFSKLG